MMMEITQPTLLLDEQKCRKNIRMMVQKAKEQQLTLRPHFKTHQAHEVGRWFREEGIDCITVSSVKMATYFAQDHWKDITIAFPINLLEIDQINTLAAQVQLNILVESETIIPFLETHLQHEVGVFIKIDVGTHRTGIDANNIPRIEGLLQQLSASQKLQVKGLLAHAGHAYRARSKAEIETTHQASTSLMKQLKAHLSSDFPNLILSVGDTPTCSIAKDFSGLDEIRPGNFAFYDAMQMQISSCTHEQVAVAMACPIVALHPERNELVIYGGGVHFAKDQLADVQLGKHFGLVVEKRDQGWGSPIPQAILQRISQEHGIIRASTDFIAKQSIGDLVHSCMTANLMKNYLTLQGKHITMML